MKPSDVLPDNAHYVCKDGIQVRKGSVAAFIANAQILSSQTASVEEKEVAAQDLRMLLPALKLIGVFDVFEIKSSIINGVVRNYLE